MYKRQLQRTVLSYFRANDELTGSSYLKELLDAFDENGDGVIDYDETGRRGVYTPVMRLAAEAMRLRAVEKYGSLRGAFASRTIQLKYSNPAWNPSGHDFTKESWLGGAARVAFMMSQSQTEGKDAFFPSITWGKGKWPSIQFAHYLAMGSTIYGLEFPTGIGLVSLYGYAFQYADKTQNGAAYTGSPHPMESDPEAANRYLKAVAEGASLLPFVLYVPPGFGSLLGRSVPNVEETEDPEKLFTAHFNNGQEVW